MVQAFLRPELGRRVNTLGPYRTCRLSRKVGHERKPLALHHQSRSAPAACQVPKGFDDMRRFGSQAARDGRCNRSRAAKARSHGKRALGVFLMSMPCWYAAHTCARFGWPLLLKQVSSEDLPTHVARVVNLPSHATSCDFHPFLHSLLLGESSPPASFAISCLQQPLAHGLNSNFPGIQLARSLDRLCCGRSRIVTACWSCGVTANSCDQHQSIGSFGLRRATGLVRLALTAGHDVHVISKPKSRLNFKASSL